MKQEQEVSPTSARDQESARAHQEQPSVESIPESIPLSLTELQVLTGTITADVTSNKKFLRTHFKIVLGLIFVVCFLKLLPSPLIIRVFENDPSTLTKDNCNSVEDCEEVREGFEAIIIKKVNPLHRQLKYFVRLNRNKLYELDGALDNGSVDLNHEITWIQIYATRNGEIFGDVIYEKSGEDAYEVIFNGEPLIYIGEVHILSQTSYLVRIYKLIHEVSDLTPRANSTNGTQAVKELSVPLTVELVRYSQFYSGAELLIRYVSFLFILYVRAETQGCPLLFQAILFFTCNPLIFTQIAFPNTASNIISSMCSNAYIFYIPIFLYYTHRRFPNDRVNFAIKSVKLLASLGLYIASVVRSLHLMNQTLVQWIQYLLIVGIMVPIIQYLWRMYFVRSKVVLHRNILFVVLTIYYFSLLFFSGYIVDYGWKKISFYIIVQTYGVSLCYLTSPSPQIKPVPATVANVTSPIIQDGQAINSNSKNYDSEKKKHILEQEHEIEDHFVNIM